MAYKLELLVRRTAGIRPRITQAASRLKRSQTTMVQVSPQEEAEHTPFSGLTMRCDFGSFPYVFLKSALLAKFSDDVVPNHISVDPYPTTSLQTPLDQATGGSHLDCTPRQRAISLPISVHKPSYWTSICVGSTQASQRSTTREACVPDCALT